MKPTYKKIYVEITNACNLKCRICPGTVRRPSFISPGSFGKILSRIRPFTEHIYLHVMGEPLLHPEFPEILRICAANGIKANIATNGILAGMHRNALLSSKSIRQISFSIHCAELQDNSGIPENYLGDILDLIREGSSTTDIFFSIRIWNLGKDSQPDPRLIRTLENFFSIDLQGLRHGSRKSARTGMTVSRNVFIDFAEQFSWPELGSSDKDGGREDRKFCRGLRDHCAILVDGTVVPCCLDKDGIMGLGNIFESELGEIIFSARARRIREGFSEGRAVEPLCINCGFRTRFDITDPKI